MLQAGKNEQPCTNGKEEIRNGEVQEVEQKTRPAKHLFTDSREFAGALTKKKQVHKTTWELQTCCFLAGMGAL